MTGTQHYFVPSVRQGLAVGIKSPTANQQLGQRAQIDVVLAATARQMGTQNYHDANISQPIQLFGPGDVLGFDSRIVVRTLPAHDVGDFEPNYFPHIEFGDADFCWRYTAKSADEASGDLTPWIALVVLASEKRSGVDLEFTEGQLSEDNLPRYIDVDASVLPPLEHAKRWVHVHVTAQANSADKNQLLDMINTQPDRAVSRLVCARRLAPGVKYTAFVVPTFKLGVQAGLGIPLIGTDNALTPAWVGGEGIIQLPYYYRWEFRTGLRGDFEHLVRLLEPRKLTDIGTRDVDCSKPGFGLEGVARPNSAAPESHYLGMEGGLQSLDSQYTLWGRDLDIAVPDAGDIYDVKVYRVAETAVEVSWHTRVPAGSMVVYGADDSYGSQVADSALKLHHRIMITGLIPDSLYHIKISSQPATGNPSTTVDRSFQLPVFDQFQIKLAELLNISNTEDIAIRDFDFNAVPKGVITQIVGTAIALGDKVEIEWRTATKRLCRIDYGRGDYAKTLSESEAVIEHKLTLPKLIPSKQYQFRIVALAAGTLGEDVAQGSFTMPPLPSVLPPVYGRWHRGVLKAGKKIVDADHQREWLDALNLDPRHRLAAGLGSEVIRAQQEPLMASAWEQFGQVEKVNEMLRRAQLARDSVLALHRKISQLRPEVFMGVTAFAQKKITRPLDDKDPRVKISALSFLSKKTLVQKAALDPAFRRVAGPKNSILKRQSRQLAGGWSRTVISRMATTELKPAGDVRVALDTPRMQDINNKLLHSLKIMPLNIRRMSTLSTSNALSPGPQPTRPGFWFDDRFLRIGDINAIDTREPFKNLPSNFSLAKPNLVSNGIQNWLQKAQNRPEPPPAKDEIFLADIKTNLAQEINPQFTIKERLTRQLRTAGKIAQRAEPEAQGDTLDPVMWAPEFWQPMYAPLRDKSQDLLLPGVEKIPQNTIGLLKTNRRFVESYLCGCNHEFAGELLWRGFPTDQRGSYFRQFWNVDEYIPRTPELDAIWQQWREANRLSSTNALPLQDKKFIFMRDIYRATDQLIAKMLAKAGVTRIDQLPSAQRNAIAALRGDSYIEYRIDALDTVPTGPLNKVIRDLVPDLDQLDLSIKKNIFEEYIGRAAQSLLEKVLDAEHVTRIEDLPTELRQAMEIFLGDYQMKDRLDTLAKFPITLINAVVKELVASTDALSMQNKKGIFTPSFYPASDSLISELLQAAGKTEIDQLPPSQQRTIAVLRGDRYIPQRIEALSLFENAPVSDVVRGMLLDLDDVPFHLKQRVFLRDFDAAIDLLIETLLADANVDNLDALPASQQQVIQALRDDRIEFLPRLPVRSFNKVIRKLATNLALQERLADINPLTAWRDGILGENRNGPTERLVLIIRGDLLKRYPGALIYAIDAVAKPCKGGERVPALREYMDCEPSEIDPILQNIKRIYPVFKATLPPDLTLLGFPFDREAACGCDGDPGKYFVIEEQITEPRFGLDTPTDDPPGLGGVGDERAWADLSWSHFGFGESEHLLHFGVYLDTPPDVEKLEKAHRDIWIQASAAKRAWITWQQPVRIAIHASQMIPETSDPRI